MLCLWRCFTGIRSISEYDPLNNSSHLADLCGGWVGCCKESIDLRRRGKNDPSCLITTHFHNCSSNVNNKKNEFNCHHSSKKQKKNRTKTNDNILFLKVLTKKVRFFTLWFWTRFWNYSVHIANCCTHNALDIAPFNLFQMPFVMLSNLGIQSIAVYNVYKIIITMTRLRNRLIFDG